MRVDYRPQGSPSARTTIAFCVAALAFCFSHPVTAQQEEKPSGAAHAIADRFAGDGEQAQGGKQSETGSLPQQGKPVETQPGAVLAPGPLRIEIDTGADDEQLAADEAEMLERARLEAEARARFDAEARAADELAADERKAAERKEIERLAEEKAARALLEAQQRAEAERAARIEAEQRAREAEQLAQRERLDRIIAKLALRVREFEAAETAQKENLNGDRETAKVVSQPASLSPAPRSGQVMSETAIVPEQAKDQIENPNSPTGTAQEPTSDEPIRRVTILLEMQPRNRTSRRFERTADPILCFGDRCWISQGADRPSELMERRKAFGTVNTLGRRAGACKRKAGCVFRNVDLGEAEAIVQPIDLNFLRHDRRELTTISADRSCRRTPTAELVCGDLFQSDTYRLWVVPEDIARSVSPDALRQVVERGLSRAAIAARHND